MKKALVLALSVFMVLALATAAFAAEVSYSGKVEVTFGGYTEGEDKEAAAFGGVKEATITVDFAKDFGEGVTAGVKTKVEAHGDAYKDQDEGDPNHGVFDPEDIKKEFIFDTEAYVKVERDLFTAQASTGIDGGVGKDFGEYNISKNPGIGLDLKLIDGLTISTIFNNARQTDTSKTYNNFLVKGEFAQDLFTVGGGYQNDAQEEKTAFGVYGSANLIDGLALKAEYGNRKEKDNDAISSILASAEYTLDALTAKLGFLMNDIDFQSLNDDDADQEYRINEAYRFDPEHKVMVLFADAAYKLTEAFEVNGNFDYLLSVKDENDKDVEDVEKLGFKVGAKYTYNALTLEGWYKAWDASQIGAKASYKLVEGVDTSFEVTSSKTDKDDKDAKLAYTAKIVATF